MAAFPWFKEPAITVDLPQVNREIDRFRRGTDRCRKNASPCRLRSATSFGTRFGRKVWPPAFAELLAVGDDH